MGNTSNELKQFATSASCAVERIIAGMDSKTKADIDTALANGCQVSISFAVDVAGGSEIHLDVVRGANRSRVATVKGAIPSRNSRRH